MCVLEPNHAFHGVEQRAAALFPSIVDSFGARGRKERPIGRSGKRPQPVQRIRRMASDILGRDRT